VSRVDDGLLDQLGVALAVTPAEPTRDEVDAMRALVVQRDGAGISRFSFAPARDRQRPLRHVLVAAALVVGLVLVGGLVTLSAGAPVPSELRAPARALGLPVDSAELAAARSAAGALRAALAGPDDVRVAASAVSLETALGRLTAGDRAKIETEARALLMQAADRLGVVVPDAAPVVRDVATAIPPAPLGEAGGAADLAAPEAPGASTTGSEVGELPPPGAAPAALETEAPDTAAPETPEAPETEAPEGSEASAG